MINNETAKSTYPVTEGRYDYPIGFQYGFNPDSTPQIKVFLNKLSDTPLEYGVDYTLSGDGASVVLSEITVGDRLDIIRDIPMVQLSNYVIGRIDPEQIENDFDEAVMRDQQLSARVDVAIEIPEDHEARIQECERDIDNIESLIPAQTTPENLLADQNFVNSSIATSTATFRGTYSSLEDLEAVTADDNDYGFVESTDAAGNTLYSRYKYTTATNPASWVFEYTLNNSSFTAAQWAAINSGITAGIVDTFDATGHNIGDVFFTMRTDNALNGAVECNGAQYNTTDFTGGQSIGELLESGKVPYVSLSQYATLLATNGSVGVFGWDGAGTTPFKVPSLNDIFIETGTAAQIGDYLAPALPNITGQFSATRGEGESGAFTSDGSKDLGRPWDGSGIGSSYVNFDASDSNAIYQNDATVQPNAVRYRAMVQLALTSTDEALETCTAVTAQVAANTLQIAANTAAIVGADYVVVAQLPTAENNYTWYRKYKSGWVEQGGIYTANGNDIVYPVTMADDKYALNITPHVNLNAQVYWSDFGHSQTTTGFSVRNTGYTGTWTVFGKAA